MLMQRLLQDNKVRFYNFTFKNFFFNVKFTSRHREGLYFSKHIKDRYYFSPQFIALCFIHNYWIFFSNWRSVAILYWASLLVLLSVTFLTSCLSHFVNAHNISKFFIIITFVRWPVIFNITIVPALDAQIMPFNVRMFCKFWLCH